MPGFESGRIQSGRGETSKKFDRAEHQQALEVVELNRQIEDLEKVLEEGVSDEKLESMYLRRLEELETNKKSIIEGYRAEKAPSSQSRRLEEVVKKLDKIKQDGRSYNEEEHRLLQDELDAIIADDVEAEERARTMQRNLEKRKVTGHAPLRSTAQIEADRKKYLEKKRREYGYEGLHVSKPTPSEEVESEVDESVEQSTREGEIGGDDDIPRLDDVVSRGGGANARHEDLRQRNLTEVEDVAYGQAPEETAEKPGGFFGRLKRWFSRQ